MPDAGGNIKGISTSGKAGETIERIFGPRKEICRKCKAGAGFEHAKGEPCPSLLPDIDMDRQFFLDEISKIGQLQLPDDVEACEWCPGVPATHEISGCPACIDCWEKAYNLD